MGHPVKHISCEVHKASCCNVQSAGIQIQKIRLCSNNSIFFASGGHQRPEQGANIPVRKFDSEEKWNKILFIEYLPSTGGEQSLTQNQC